MSKLKLLVSPADTANNSERWYEFVVYLSRKLDQAVGLDTAFDKDDFHSRMHQADLVFATPQEAVLLHQKAGYVPTCRPQNQAEEVVFVTHSENPDNSLSQFNGADVITAKNTTPTRLGLTLLAKKGIKPASVNGKNAWMHVIKAMQNDTSACGFLSKNFYDELNPLSRDSIQVLGTSKLNRVYPQMLVKSQHQEVADGIAMTLLSMSECDKGKQVLEKLGMSGWTESSSNELQQLGQLLRIA